MLDQDFEICQLETQFLSPDNFREQIAVLIPGAMQDGVLLAHKSLVNVCQPGLASFDQDSPGEGTWESWQHADSLIESGAVGFYHTHPPNFSEFSPQDWKFIEGLAQANGKKFIWHLMQPANYSTARCVCAHMRHRGYVDVYDFGCISMNHTDTVVGLPLPPAWSTKSPTMHIARMDEDE